MEILHFELKFLGYKEVCQTCLHFHFDEFDRVVGVEGITFLFFLNLPSFY